MKEKKRKRKGKKYERQKEGETTRKTKTEKERQERERDMQNESISVLHYMSGMYVCAKLEEHSHNITITMKASGVNRHVSILNSEIMNV